MVNRMMDYEAWLNATRAPPSDGHGSTILESHRRCADCVPNQLELPGAVGFRQGRQLPCTIQVRFVEGDGAVRSPRAPGMLWRQAVLSRETTTVQVIYFKRVIIVLALDEGVSATQHWRYSRAERGSQCTPSPTIDYHNATQTINYLTWQSTY